MRAGVLYSAGLIRRLTRDGGFWFAHTGPYELYYRTGAGDTLRMFTKPFEPQPVTDTEIDAAVAGLEWFTRQGGRIDRSQFPDVKPAIEAFQLAGDGTIWVQPTMPTVREHDGTVFEVFDAAGFYLGRVTAPFRIQSYVYPVIRDGWMLAVTQDDLDVPYVVLSRIENYRVPAPGDRPVEVPLGD